MSFYKDFVPKSEAALAAFIDNFGTRISATPTAFGLVAGQATAFQTLASAFIAAWDVTKVAGTRSGSAVIVKNEAKAAVVENLRTLAKIIQAYPGTTNAQRSLLGLTVPAERQPIGVPTTAPAVEKRSVNGNLVSILMHEEGSTRRAKPAGVATAQVYSYVGAAAPTDPRDWFFEGATTRNIIDLVFADALPAGTKVWVCAAWANERGQAGPSSAPLGLTLVGGTASPTALQVGGNLSLAA